MKGRLGNPNEEYQISKDIPPQEKSVCQYYLIILKGLSLLKLFYLITSLPCRFVLILFHGEEYQCNTHHLGLPILSLIKEQVVPKQPLGSGYTVQPNKNNLWPNSTIEPIIKSTRSSFIKLILPKHQQNIRYCTSCNSLLMHIHE